MRTEEELRQSREACRERIAIKKAEIASRQRQGDLKHGRLEHARLEREARRARIADMAWDVDPREAYDRISRELNGGQPMTKRSEWGDALLAHTHSVGEDGSSLVVDVWRDQAGMDAFIGRLRPILEREGFADQMNVRVFDTTDLVIEG